MSVVTASIYDRLAGDPTLVGILASYNSLPAIFTTDPVPGDATMPYIITAGDVVSNPFDTKTNNGRELWRDIRCYTNADGSALAIEEITERVHALLHRHNLTVPDFGTIVAACSGPIVADEQDVYGRVVTVRLVIIK